jgi:3-hydroxyisobutyrate dehydrogenase-like beta-hydroxyacid dehydrogenase
MMVQRVAVLGTGMMGFAVARALRAGGFAVHAWNRTSAKAQPLAAFGVAVHTNVAEAVAEADLIIPVVEDCAQAAALLNVDGVQLAGKDVLNLVTGSPREIEALVAALERAGARVASGTIMCFPAEIGMEHATIMFGGSADFWARRQAVVTCLGGGSMMVGEAPSLPNKFDTAMVGCLFVTTFAAFAEAAKYLSREGVDPRSFAPFIPATFASLQAKMEEAIDSMASGDFSTDQATITTFARTHAMFRRSMADARVTDHMLEAGEAWLRTAIAAGDGSSSLAALIRH